MSKASNLLQMEQYGYNVPSFIVIEPTDNDSSIKEKLSKLDLNSSYSVRSSPEVSMPGMLDTILDVKCKCNDDFIKYILDIRNSIKNKRAEIYAKMKGIELKYPQVVIQKMVYGDRNNTSCSGILFSRNANGISELNGEYVYGKGEELVSNKSDSYKIDSSFYGKFGLKKNDIEKQLSNLERYFKCAVEVEFTIEDKVLYYLQVRKLNFDNYTEYLINKDLFDKGIISELTGSGNEFDYSYNESDYENLDFEFYVINNGFVKAELTNDISKYEGKILLLDKLLNEDVFYLEKIKGLITRKGSYTSHPANLCRNMNIPYIISQEDFSEYIGKELLFDLYNNKILRPVGK